MKMVFLRDLEPECIIGKSVYSNEGKLLIKSGTKTTRDNINFLRKNMIFFVYIEEDALDDVKIDEEFDKIRGDTLGQLPGAFQNLLVGDKENFEKTMNVMNNLVDYIVADGSTNINLYELKNYDQYTYIHCIDTGIMTCFLGKSLGYSGEKLKELSISGLLHDIGKVKIPNEIINKKEKLTEEEFNTLKLHAKYGTEIIGRYNIFSKEILRGIYEHHEKYDGTGYPRGLKGDQISEYARIISICDVFTAVSANRSYRKRFNPSEAYELILSGSGTSFDPNIVQKLRMTFFVYPLGSCVRLSNGVEGYVVRQNESFPDRPIIRVTYDTKTRQPISPYEVDLMGANNVVIQEVV